MATPDVRIRLSTEGLAEVVSAFRRIQSESQKTGTGAAKGFETFGNSLRGVRSLLAQLGVAVGVAGLVAFARQSSEAADETGKMSQRLGATVEQLSALRVSAQDAGVADEQLQQSLGLVASRIRDLRQGESGAVKLFREISVSARDFKGKNTAENFELVAKAIAAIPDPGERAAFAMDFFGKKIALNLLPFVNDLAERGLPALITEAERLGLVMRDEDVAAATRLNDDFKRLTLQSQALTTQFLSGLTPSLHQVAGAFSGASSETDSFRRFGEFVGVILKGIVLLFDNVSVSIERFVLQLVGAVAKTQALARGDFNRAVQIGQEVQTKIETARFFLEERRRKLTTSNEEQISALERRRAAETQALAKATTDVEVKEGKRALAEIDAEIKRLKPATRREPTDEGGAEGELRASQARLAAARTAVEDQLKLVQAGLKAEEEAQRRALEANRVSLTEHYAERQRIQREAFQAEIDALEERRRVEAQDPDPDKAAAAVASIESEIQRKRIEFHSVTTQLQFEESQSIEKAARERVDIERRLLELRGDHHRVALLQIEEEVKKSSEVLEKLDQARRATFIGPVAPPAPADQEFGIRIRAVQDALDELHAEQAELFQDALEGDIEAERELVALEAERLPQLRQLADDAVRAADATGRAASQDQAAAAARQVQAEQVRASRTAAVSFEEITRQAQLDLSDFDVERAAIQQRINAGLLSQVAGEGQILDLERQRLPELERIAQAALAAAEATGNPEQIAAARDLAAAVDEVALSIESAENASARFTATLQDSTVDALSGFLVESQGATKGIAEAWHNMTQAIIQDIARLIARMVALAIVQRAIGFFGGGKFLPTFITKGEGGGFAAGGLVRGPGTEESDSIPARLSDREFVVRARVVRQPGVQDFLAALNREDRKSLAEVLRFRYGGPVRRRDGGLVLGSGGPTEDNISAWLSSGEFVVRARAVARPGVHQFLQQVNQEQPDAIRLLGEVMQRSAATPPVRESASQRYAEGGIVNAGNRAGGAWPSGPRVVVHQTINALDTGSVRDRLRSPFGSFREAIEDDLQGGVV